MNALMNNMGVRFWRPVVDLLQRDAPVAGMPCDELLALTNTNMHHLSII
jgi:hypothetical protein